ncbi:MAG: hypothetical protein ACO3YV_05305, partial [Pelagibacteraceae bacterium]
MTALIFLFQVCPHNRTFSHQDQKNQTDSGPLPSPSGQSPEGYQTEPSSDPAIDIVIPRDRPYKNEPLERIARLAYDYQSDLKVLQELRYELAHRSEEQARQLRQHIQTR